MGVRRRGAWCLAAALLAAVTSPNTVGADAPAPTRATASATPPPTRARRALAVGAALIPGLVVRGAGHWVVGERRTARRLLAAEGLGLALAAAGGIPIGVSGGAGETLPGLVLLLPGSALLLTSLAADLWGAAGGACHAGAPLVPDALTLALGYAFVADPRLPFANLATAAVEGRRGPGLATASGWFADGAWRARGAAGLRLRGAGPGERRRDGSWLELEVAVAEERRRDQGFAVATVEGGVRGRLDLAHVGPSLAGSFATLGLGLGAERVRYTTAPVATADTSSLGTAHFGWGVVLGDGHARTLEAELYYEHRRDTLAGGLTLPTPGNGFVGFFGATATAWRDRWGATVSVEVGSAWALSLAARVRFPEVFR